MIAEYMEKGFLENIIDMFRHDRGLYQMIADLIRDNRIRVRLGITALVETLSREDSQNIKEAIPQLLKNLKNEDPVVRGDAAYLIGLIGGNESIPYLLPLLDDTNNNVKQIVQESIEEIKRRIS